MQNYQTCPATVPLAMSLSPMASMSFTSVYGTITAVYRLTRLWYWTVLLMRKLYMKCTTSVAWSKAYLWIAVKLLICKNVFKKWNVKKQMCQPASELMHSSFLCCSFHLSCVVLHCTGESDSFGIFLCCVHTYLIVLLLYSFIVKDCFTLASCCWDIINHYIS